MEKQIDQSEEFKYDPLEAEAHLAFHNLMRGNFQINYLFIFCF